jgi:endonuclease/exonuclease/phosphatase family metal-dependent hydrolase
MNKRWLKLLRAGLFAALAAAFAGLPAAAQAPAPAPAFNIATYNLRLNLARDGANAWPHRKEAVKALIRHHEFDIVGTQEGLPEQIDDLAAMAGFAHVGVGRDDGLRGGEHAAIFFRVARFKLEDHGDFWLSQTPEQPSMGWDARCCKRIATWVRLLDRPSGQRFLVFNAHFDHEGLVARRESAHLMLRKIAEIAGDLQVLFIGDLNSTPETPQVIALQAVMRDAYLVTITPPYGPVGTFNDFKLDAAMTDRIDYIFVGPRVQVLKYAVLSDSFGGRYPSDHHPVVARVQLEGSP